VNKSLVCKAVLVSLAAVALSPQHHTQTAGSLPTGSISNEGWTGTQSREREGCNGNL